MTPRVWVWPAVALFLLMAIFLATALVSVPAPAQTLGGGTTTTPPKGNVDIDDRDQTNVCENVVNFILNDVQSPDVNNTQNVTTGATNSNEQTVGGETVAVGDTDNDQTVTVTPNQVTQIAQELNISPTIVQQCIQQNAGRDAIIIIDDGGKHHGGKHDRDDGKRHDGKVAGERIFDDGKRIFDDGKQFGGKVAGERTVDVILETIPRKPLPNTGGSPVVWAGIVALVALYAALLTWRLRRRGW